ncbi:MAG: Gfo/Idh/MocA family oxidoreductase [Trueperaceae bacterium]|nr:Gfo/Idh/MocA family oxidoreductase [Trueperaceae bacterium]
MNIAMIGAGGYAKAHLDMLEKQPELKIVGHVSPTPSSREAAAERYGGRAYGHCKDLLDNEQVDAAWISVPPHVHGEIEKAFIDRGIPFLVEKPLSADLETAERIATQIKASGLIVAVGYKFRAMSALAEVKSAIKKHSPHLMLAAWHGDTPGVSWWQRQDQSGGQIVEQATHLVDLARYLLGEARVIGATASYQARAAYPNLDVATSSTGTLKFANGVTGFLSASCLLKDVNDIYLKLICEGLLITIRPQSVVVEAGSERRELRVKDDLVALENMAFLEAVRNNDPTKLLSSYEDALLTHRLCVDMREMAMPQRVH